MESVVETRAEADATFQRGVIALHGLEYDAAQCALDEALLLYRQISDVPGEANCIYNRGLALLRTQNYHAAQSAFVEARPLYRQTSNVVGEANCICEWGNAALCCNEEAPAERAFAEALPLYRKVDTEISRIYEPELVAFEATYGMRPGSRARDSEHAAAISGQANCIAGQASLAVRRSDIDAAESAFEEALRLFGEASDLLGEVAVATTLVHLRTERAAGNKKVSLKTALLIPFPVIRPDGRRTSKNNDNIDKRITTRQTREMVDNEEEQTYQDLIEAGCPVVDAKKYARALVARRRARAQEGPPPSKTARYVRAPTRRARGKPRPRWHAREGDDLSLTPTEFVARYYAAEMATTTPRPQWDKDGPYADRPAEFIAMAYAAEMAAGTLHRRMIEDRSLVKILSNWLRTHDMPEGIEIPTYPQWNKRQLAARKERPSSARSSDSEEKRLIEVERKQTARKGGEPSRPKGPRGTGRRFAA